MPLVPGMFCRVTVTGRTLTDVVVVPRKALQTEDTVFLADAQDRLMSRTVQVTYLGDDIAVISKGINAGDRVVVTALPDGTEKMQLKVREPEQKKVVSR